ncbi:putative lysine-specific demethylase JMJ16 isoform X2 [Durio zibethinus]|uniref:Lysine-specific demethylase JMJ16 isoform X2 n=1 Tax=Durio zibethinus TaxID=66656 RepID=A0A6P6A0V4_DURZI|nr:putative lysine-specific demethylase JMJ16 isoform X2 [Durio zibethinus]
MGAEHWKTRIENESPARLSAPPGFASLSSFFLKKVEHREENLGFKDSKDASTQGKLQVEAKSDVIDVEKLKESVGNRPWILYDKSDQIAREYHSMQHYKATVMQYPGEARRDVLEEAPVFHPSEEEFNDALKYIESIRLKAEPYGICRVVPPPSWQPPCLIKEKGIWENSTFVTQIQQFDKFPAQSVRSKTAEVYTGASKRRSSGMSFQQGFRSEYSMNPEDVACLDMELNVSKPGPEFTLKTFKKYADDFVQHHFFSKHKDADHHVNCKQGEPSVESIEGEYRKIVENPTGVLEVLYGDNLDTITFGSGFPTALNSWEVDNYPSYIHSSWNLNNVPKLPGSLLSFESDKTSGVLVPQLRIGMCFSSQYWKVEEHHLYSLCYMHVGSPKIWHCVPGRYSFKFEAFMKKFLPDSIAKQFKLHQEVTTGLSPFMLKSEGVPVYRCIQYPREFVLNAAALYQALGRETSISFNKLLIEAAREAVKAQWELSLLKKNTIDNLRWKGACGKNGILTETLKSCVKQEGNRREYLCTTSQKRKDKNFNATGKKECSICYFDLYLSAAHCPCSADRYSCLNHAKRLCSCTWTDKIFLYQYEISELNILVEALEGKFSAVYRWAREDLNLGLHYYIPNENSCTKDKGQKEHTFQDAGTCYSNGWTTASSIKAEIKARLRQSQYLNQLKSEEKTVSTPSLPSVSQDDTSMLLREMMSKALSSSKSMSSSSESEETADLNLNDGGEGRISSTCSSRPPNRPEREVTLSELLKDISHKHGKTKHFKSTSKGLPLSHPASKKRKKK